MPENQLGSMIGRRRFLRLAAGAVVTGAGVSRASGGVAQPATAPSTSLVTAGDRDVTFFVASDTHYGIDQAETNEAGNKSAIAVLNTLAGQSFPSREFGVIAQPRAILIPGDLTDSGTAVNFNGYSRFIGFGSHIDGYIDDFPVNGGKGHQLKYPVIESYGNHDIDNQSNDLVLQGIARRNGESKLKRTFCDNRLHSAWDWDDVRFVNVNLYPGKAGWARDSLPFLAADLRVAVGDSRRPVVIMQHYGFDDFSLEPRWWTDAQRAEFHEVIKNYNVVAIFSGHQHWADRVEWNGINDYVLPRAKGGNNTDGVYAVRMTDRRMIVAHRRLSGAWDHVWTQDLSPRA
jgi:cytolysin (calcineurin-like family phosphatase)